MTPLKPYKMPFRTRVRIRLGMWRIWLRRQMNAWTLGLAIPAAVVATLVIAFGPGQLSEQVTPGDHRPVGGVDVAAVYERHQKIVTHIQLEELEKFSTHVERERIERTQLKNKVTLAESVLDQTLT